MTTAKKNMLNRIIVYILGMVFLALGIILNTKADLGVSPIISVAYCVSEINGLSFGNVTLIWYCIFILVEVIIHLGQGKKRQVLLDLPQIIVSILFTRVMNLFSAYIPIFHTAYPDTFWGTMAGQIVVLLVAVILTGIGAAMTVFVRLVPNPGDGIVQAIADVIHKGTGLVKNGFDLLCICLTIAVSLIITGHLVGIGIGTVIAVIGVGRVVALFQMFFYDKISSWMPEDKNGKD